VSISPLEEGIQVIPGISFEEKVFGAGRNIVEIAAGMNRILEGGAEKRHVKMIPK
jgi:hypothetical protein